jgi:hypothetical protein
VALYAVFTVALERLEGLTVSVDAAFTVSVYAWLPVRELELLSVAVMVKLELPVVVGVPLNTPVAPLRLSHEGRAPRVTANV